MLSPLEAAWGCGLAEALWEEEFWLFSPESWCVWWLGMWTEARLSGFMSQTCHLF